MSFRLGRDHQPVPLARDSRPIFPHQMRVDGIEMLVHPGRKVPLGTLREQIVEIAGLRGSASHHASIHGSRPRARPLLGDCLGQKRASAWGGPLWPSFRDRRSFAERKSTLTSSQAIRALSAEKFNGRSWPQATAAFRSAKGTRVASARERACSSVTFRPNKEHLPVSPFAPRKSVFQYQLSLRERTYSNNVFQFHSSKGLPACRQPLASTTGDARTP